MASSQRKFVLDTNLYVRAFRDRAANDALAHFHAANAPFEYMSAVVAQELRAGARSAKARRDLDRHVIGPFRRRGRLLVPSAGAWETSGDVLAKLAQHDGLDLVRLPKSFGNDVLLALSCRESGFVLVTDNAADFERIAAHAPFEFARPWP